MTPQENAEQYDALAQKWMNGTITSEEAKVYADWYNAHSDIPLEIPASFASSEEELRGQIWESISGHHGQKATVVTLPKKRYGRLMAAASVVALLGLCAYLFYTNRQQKPATPQQTVAMHDVAPGRTGAILTLANGSTIVLDSTGNGNIATQGNVRVVKRNGQIVYVIDKTNNITTIGYNTMATPNGRQYQLVLPDGTEVWLNAASSIKYPTAFKGNERRVEITGEAYFEVAHNAAMPFKVAINGKAEVEVLGTHFNINAYNDEANIKTTLLEGSVKQLAVGSGRSAVLKPGEQAQLGKKGDLKVVDDANLEETMAWKNGNFLFHDADLATIMRQIARWYDVEIVFQDKIDDSYTVLVSRDVPVSKLLQFLEASGGVHFEINGKKIMVKK